MRAVLILNPNATSTTSESRDLFIHALQNQCDVDVYYSLHRDHGVELGRLARDHNVDCVMIHGGDGTVHSVVNGLVGSSLNAIPERLPAIGIIPGGSANVFAKALGISADPFRAMNQLLQALQSPSSIQYRSVGLVHCGDRWSILNAGLGLDGQVVASIEAKRHHGMRVSPQRYMAAAVPHVLATMYHRPKLQICINNQELISGIYCAFISNGNPWTYIDHHPVWTTSSTQFSTDMGILASRKFSLWSTTRLLTAMLTKKGPQHGGYVIRHDSAQNIRVTCPNTLLHAQVDGESIGLRSSMEFHSVPHVIRVIAPHESASHTG